MKISLITVCYNSSKTIEKTFLSVKNQTYKNIEYIVIDGNSNDGTNEIIKKYDYLISKSISENDKGLYDAMNKGIKIAEGDIVGILNSDDFFYDNYVLEKVADFHIKNKIDASIGNIVQLNTAGKKIRVYSSKHWKTENLKRGFMPPHPSVFIKKDLFNQLGYYHLDFVIGADYEMIVRFFLKNKISWKYSNITTTSMLIGGVSTSGFASYNLKYYEICKALTRNNINFSKLNVYFRGISKIIEFLVVPKYN